MYLDYRQEGWKLKEAFTWQFSILFWATRSWMKNFHFGWLPSFLVLASVKLFIHQSNFLLPFYVVTYFLHFLRETTILPFFKSTNWKWGGVLWKLFLPVFSFTKTKYYLAPCYQKKKYEIWMYEFTLLRTWWWVFIQC